MDAWEAIEKKSVTECIPVRGIIELNYFCNFNCVFCYLGPQREQKTFIDADMALKIGKQLRKAGTLTITLSGGEPLANPDFENISRNLHAMGFGLRIFTNAALIDTQTADMLSDLNLLSLDVSLYGASEEVYEAITGRTGQFMQISRAMELLRERAVPVVIKTVIHRANQHETEQMNALVEEWGFPVIMTPLLTPTDCGDSSPCGMMMSDDDLKQWFKDHKQKPISRSDEDILCTSGRSSFVIAPNGDVFPCIQIRRPVGNLLKQDFNEIWHTAASPLLKQIRALRYKDMLTCNSCQDAQYCFICPGLNLLMSGDLYKPDSGHCRLARNIASS